MSTCVIVGNTKGTTQVYEKEIIINKSLNITQCSCKNNSKNKMDECMVYIQTEETFQSFSCMVNIETSVQRRNPGESITLDKRKKRTILREKQFFKGAGMSGENL